MDYMTDLNLNLQTSLHAVIKRVRSFRYRTSREGFHSM